MTVTIEAIEAYLSDHPEAVLSLKLKSTEGSNTISFAERRAEALEERLTQTQAKLQELIDVSKDNERLFQACKTCLIELIEGRDINALAPSIERSLGEAFSVHAHHLFLFEDGEVTQALISLVSISQNCLVRWVAYSRRALLGWAPSARTKQRRFSLMRTVWRLLLSFRFEGTSSSLAYFV